MKSNDFEWFHRPAWQQLLWQQLVIILLLVGFYFGVWQENQHEIDALRSSITERQYHTAQSQQHIKERPSLSDIQQQIQHIKRELDQDSNISSKGISSKNAPPKNTNVLKRLYFPLLHSGSQLIEWKNHRENNQVSWHIVLSLNYGQFLYFLSEIQQLQPPLLIKHLTIKPMNDNLTVRIVLSDIVLSDIEQPDITLPDKIQSVSGYGDKS
ncbi:hypothetical protein HZS38_14885 [Xenorhabdus nematophila]|uniref:hypothetical protein n=1 Tax=Xenorhabdus nematophila TaxID=628 RepID=UPI0003275B6A|nr:hypothetical protein [Xenorhabdus nematophila]CEE91214.1 conserved hypothetical protein [Xenorhabdus nematophila str. Anatoliense]CEF29393.1 conserved hypothetical protein [Xenorhabdus nematophila str. Websteri]AYA41628.1 hypothetical protein D3790_15275 [Xenorhabdus nematophila]MBA0020365.1 hypothetical protein [Xenorhabdus nematophila]MCB4424980.1 hypothetical protein [Xenorhabdus nematophila]